MKRTITREYEDGELVRETIEDEDLAPAPTAGCSGCCKRCCWRWPYVWTKPLTWDTITAPAPPVTTWTYLNTDGSYVPAA